VFITTNTPARGDASANAPAVPSARQEEEELNGLEDASGSGWRRANRLRQHRRRGRRLPGYHHFSHIAHHQHFTVWAVYLQELAYFLHNPRFSSSLARMTFEAVYLIAAHGRSLSSRATSTNIIIHDDGLLMASSNCFWILFCWSGMIIPCQLLSKQDVYIVFTLLANCSFSSKHLSYISVMCRLLTQS
jgi:hypothetical protein